MSEKPEIIVITGEIGQGKTTFVKKLINELRERKIRVAGILAIGKDSKGIREGFDLLNILTGEKIRICSTSFCDNHLRIGRYYFDPVAFETGNQWLKNPVNEDPDIMVIDEVGPLELEGKGWSESIDFLLKKNGLLQVWIIRIQLVEKILSKWNVADTVVFNIGSDKPGDIFNYIMNRKTGRYRN